MKSVKKYLMLSNKKEVRTGGRTYYGRPDGQTHDGRRENTLVARYNNNTIILIIIILIIINMMIIIKTNEYLTKT